MAEQAIGGISGYGFSPRMSRPGMCSGAGSGPRVEVHSLAQDQTADGPASVAAHAASAGAHVTLAEARTAKVRTAVVADATDKISSNSDAG
jgi:hypothetical protein